MQSFLSDITKKSTQFQIFHFLLPFGIALSYFSLIDPTNLPKSLVTIFFFTTFFGTILTLVNPVERTLFWYTTKKSREIEKTLVSSDSELEKDIKEKVEAKFEDFRIHPGPSQDEVKELMDEYYEKERRQWEDYYYEPKGDITTGDIEFEIQREVEIAKRKKWFDLKTSLESNFFYSIYLEKDRFNMVVLFYSTIWFLFNILFFLMLTTSNAPKNLTWENITNPDLVVPVVGMGSMVILSILSSVKIFYSRKKLPMIFNLVELFYQLMEDPSLNQETDFNDIQRFIQIGDWETVAKLVKTKITSEKIGRVSNREFLLKINELINLEKELLNIEKERLELEKKQFNSNTED